MTYSNSLSWQAKCYATCLGAKYIDGSLAAKVTVEYKEVIKMGNTHSPPSIGIVYQTKGKTLDTALSAKESSSKVYNNIKLYHCLGDSYAEVDLNGNLTAQKVKFNTDVFRLQLLIRDKLSQFSIRELSESTGNLEITFDVDEFMHLVGYTTGYTAIDKANTVRNINNGLAILQHMLYHIGNRRNYYRFIIISSVKKLGDVFTVKLSQEFIALIVESCRYGPNNKLGKGLFTKFSRSIYALNNIDDMKVLFYLECHYSMNNNKHKNLHNKLSIGSIANVLLLPKTRSEVKSTNYFMCMVNPVLKSLNRLVNKGLIEYTLYEKNSKEPILEDRLKVLKANPEVFLKANVIYKCLELEQYEKICSK